MASKFISDAESYHLNDIFEGGRSDASLSINEILSNDENMGILDRKNDLMPVHESFGGAKLKVKVDNDSIKRNTSFHDKFLDFDRKAEQYERERKSRSRERQENRSNGFRERSVSEYSKERSGERNRGNGFRERSVSEYSKERSGERKKIENLNKLVGQLEDKVKELTVKLNSPNETVRQVEAVPKMTTNLISFESESESEPEIEFPKKKNNMPAKETGFNHYLPIPSNLIVSKKVDFRMLRHISSLLGNNKKNIDKNNFYEFLRSVCQIASLCPSMTTASFNTFLFSQLSEENKSRLGSVNIIDMDSVTFVSHIAQTLGAADSLSACLSAFHTYLPGRQEKSLLSFFHNITSLADRVKSISDESIWLKFLAHLPLELGIHLKTNLDNYKLNHMGKYPSRTKGSSFLYATFGDMLKVADRKFVDFCRNLSSGKSSNQVFAVQEKKGKKEKKQKKESVLALANSTPSLTPERYCQNCDTKSHNTDSCYKLRTCNICGQVGHTWRVCRDTCVKCPRRNHVTESCTTYKTLANQPCQICLTLTGQKLMHEENDCTLKAWKAQKN